MSSLTICICVSVPFRIDNLNGNSKTWTNIRLSLSRIKSASCRSDWPRGKLCQHAFTPSNLSQFLQGSCCQSRWCFTGTAGSKLFQPANHTFRFQHKFPSLSTHTSEHNRLYLQKCSLNQWKFNFILCNEANSKGGRTCRKLRNCKCRYGRAYGCIYTLHCPGGKLNEMKATVNTNQHKNRLRILSKHIPFDFFELASLNHT